MGAAPLDGLWNSVVGSIGPEAPNLGTRGGETGADMSIHHRMSSIKKVGPEKSGQ